MSDISDRIAALPADKQAILLRRLPQPKRSTAAESEHYDVAILGGGMAGLTLALQLTGTRPGIRVLVVEKQRHPAPEAAHKVGESTVEIGAHYLREILGMKDHLEGEQLRKFGLRMFFADHDNQDIARRVEIGSTAFPPLPTYQLDRGRLENELGRRVVEEGVEFLDGTAVVSVAIRPQDERHRVRIRDAAGEREVQARWVVDASGRHRLLQRQLGLGKRVGHSANAVWFRVAHPIDIKDWSDDPAWQERISVGDRALSTNHLMGPGYWVWLIRLASGSISIGIVTDPDAHSFDRMNRFDRALEWLREHEPQCARAIDEHRDEIQDFRVMKNYSYSCEKVYSGTDRWCLTGEAGVFLDPLYSPGIDMIAIGNGLIVDLIGNSLDGADVQARAVVHDSLFLRLATIWLAVYEQQYTLMGNARVMISKIIWDTAFYWGVFGLLYFHDKFRQLTDSPSVTTGLGRLTELSNRMQLFFREWEAIDAPDLRADFVDLFSPLNFMVTLHHGMADGLSPAEFDVRFADNVRLFEQLAGQLVSTVIAAHVDDPEARGAYEQIRRWQTEPLVADLVRTYRRESRHRPTSDGWMPVARRELDEVAR
jgi:flavin-dependent dehydrogenase